MKVSKVLASASVAGVVLASSVSASALAWHPKGVIKKSVQNQTVGAQLSDANDAGSAVSAKPGDILKYVIEIRNDGEQNDKNHNDMHYTVLSDVLPAGVELVSEGSKREITETVGVIKTGQKVTKEYLVKVTSTKDGDVIENKACFTGDSEPKDKPQAGCDSAVVKVTVPKKEETPPATTPTKPETPKEDKKPAAPAETKPEELPTTGPETLLAPLAAIGSGAAAYAGRLAYLKRREQ